MKKPLCPNRKGNVSVFSGHLDGVHTGDNVSVVDKTRSGKIILSCLDCWRTWYSNSKAAYAMYNEDAKLRNWQQ